VTAGAVLTGLAVAGILLAAVIAQRSPQAV
jgi:hypothetical protein